MVQFANLGYSAEVSLFTREWIEIELHRTNLATLVVSLFTREWIEM